MQSINRVAVAASQAGASGPVYDVVQLSFFRRVCYNGSKVVRDLPKL